MYKLHIDYIDGNWFHIDWKLVKKEQQKHIIIQNLYITNAGRKFTIKSHQKHLLLIKSMFSTFRLETQPILGSDPLFGRCGPKLTTPYILSIWFLLRRLYLSTFWFCFSSIDIDECLDGLHNCDVNATCINLIGSFTCRCNHGFFSYQTNSLSGYATVGMCAGTEACITVYSSIKCRRSRKRV